MYKESVAVQITDRLWAILTVYLQSRSAQNYMIYQRLAVMLLCVLLQQEIN